MASGLFTLKQVNQAINLGAWSGYEFPKSLEYLVVAGGGAGAMNRGGGGGAGGLLQGSLPVTIGASYTVTVGGGGAGRADNGQGNSGSNSVFGSITATGGGGGGDNTGSIGSAGGSGGGSGNSGGDFGGQGVLGQGSNGGGGTYAGGEYGGGGGGGAGNRGGTGTGSYGGYGGVGIASNITGASIMYSGGGGGSSYSTPSAAGAGGLGGGGSGGSAAGISGTANTGGGGGGTNGGTSGSGGSGIVVVAYPGNIQFYTGGIVSYANGKTVHTFTSSGTLAPTTPTTYDVTDVLLPKSLRFVGANSTSLSRSVATTSNRKTWTWSAWLKWTDFASGYPYLFYSGTTQILFFADGLFRFAFNNPSAAGKNIYSKANYRDFNSWYHFMLVLDTTQSTNTDRVKFFVNGAQISPSDLNIEEWPTQNQDLTINTGSATNYVGAPSGNTFSGYMSEVNFVDGLALTPAYFGYTNPNTGVWSPIKYTGAYGANGFYLNFSDTSNTTATTLGKDYSGNSNNYTPSNFSLTAGSAYDSFVDSPTMYGVDSGKGGEVRGNYATFNPASINSTYGSISNGNLRYTDTTAAGSFQAACTNMFATSGKYYAEFVSTDVSGTNYSNIGICTPPVSENFYVEKTATGYVGYGYGTSGDKSTNDTYTATGTTYAAGDVISVAVDIDNSKVWFAKNGTWIGSGNPATGANPAFTIASGRPYGFACNNGSSATSVRIDANFGQRPWTYTAPTGFKALCTTNLASPTIGTTGATLASKYFNAVAWTGNGTLPRSITGYGFQPDIIIGDRRDVGYGNFVFDSIRGSKRLTMASTAVEDTYTRVSSFDADGFTSSGSVDNGNNFNGATYIDWGWKGGGTAVSNTAGSITSSVSANTTSGCSIVTFTATANSGTIGHGLGVAPKMIILKSRSNTSNWVVYHESLGTDKYLNLNTTDSVITNTSTWQNTAPTSTVFSSNGPFLSTWTEVAYCFAEVPGFSKFSYYTGNGSTSGTYIYTGFRPKFLLVKAYSGTSAGSANWLAFDTVRNIFNGSTYDYKFAWNLTDAENSSSAGGSGVNTIDFMANGFRCKTTNGSTNESGTTYIYAAFAETPFKYARAR